MLIKSPEQVDTVSERDASDAISDGKIRRAMERQDDKMSAFSASTQQRRRHWTKSGRPDSKSRLPPVLRNTVSPGGGERKRAGIGGTDDRMPDLENSNPNVPAQTPRLPNEDDSVSPIIKTVEKAFLKSPTPEEAKQPEIVRLPKNPFQPRRMEPRQSRTLQE